MYLLNLYSPNFTSAPLYNASQKVWEFIQEIPAVEFAVAPCPVYILNNAENRYYKNTIPEFSSTLPKLFNRLKL